MMFWIEMWLLLGVLPIPYYIYKDGLKVEDIFWSGLCILLGPIFLIGSINIYLTDNNIEFLQIELIKPRGKRKE